MCSPDWEVHMNIYILYMFFVASMLFPHNDLKAHEHSKIRRMTSQLRKWDPPKSM